MLEQRPVLSLLGTGRLFGSALLFKTKAEQFLSSPAGMDGHPIPAIVNRESGGADDAAQVLSEVGGFEILEVAPNDMRDAMRRAIASGAPRILVAGGDGTLCMAAQLLAECHTELAILPSGTLNHFAKHLGLPSDLRDAALVARGGIVRPVDAGRVNGRLFLNTSSVGAYESFVRRRQRLERRWGYKLASIVAGWQVLVTSHTERIEFEIDGVTTTYRTPLIFVGVGERELRIPALGGRIDNGNRGLHLMIVRDRSGARLASLALAAAARGVDALSRTPALDSLIVDRFTIDGPHRTASLDGELIDVGQTLSYEFVPAAISVVVSERRASTRSDPLTH